LSQSEQQPGHFPEIDMLLLENIHTNQWALHFQKLIESNFERNSMCIL
jgi:hypothetical protein